MTDLTKTTLKKSGSAVFSETLTANVQLPSPIQEPMDVKADKSSSVLAYGNVKTLEFGVQTDLTFPCHVPDDVQNVLNAYTVTAEVTIEDTSFSETMLTDSSRSEYLQSNPLFNYNLPSPPLADEDMEILYQSLSSSDELDPELFQRAVQDYRILSPPLSDNESQLISPDDLEYMDIGMDEGETEDSKNN